MEVDILKNKIRLYQEELDKVVEERDAVLAALKDCMKMSLFTNPEWDAAIEKAEGRYE